jgi:geranylgeranyl diphosphate synthase type II
LLLLAAVGCGALAARGVRALRAARAAAERLEKLRKRISEPRAAPLRRASAAALLRARTYGEYRAEVDALVERALELGEFGKPGRLASACALAVRGGKRLRPIIVLELSRAQGAVDAAQAALFVEFLHAASLVIDDLPAFDDDRERRGGPSVHAQAGPAAAQLAALSLVAAAFQEMCRQVDWLRAHAPEGVDADNIGARLCHDACRALGAQGAAAGQFMDSVLGGAELFREHGPEALLELARLKTAAFFEIAFLAGWLVGGGAAAESEALRLAGRHFGTAYQLADDIADMAEDAARRRAGKPGWNYANWHGAGRARREVGRSLARCRKALLARRLYTPLWGEIFGQVGAACGPAAGPRRSPQLQPPQRPVVEAEAPGLLVDPFEETPEAGVRGDGRALLPQQRPGAAEVHARVDHQVEQDDRRRTGHARVAVDEDLAAGADGALDEGQALVEVPGQREAGLVGGVDDEVLDAGVAVDPPEVRGVVAEELEDVGNPERLDAAGVGGGEVAADVDVRVDAGRRAADGGGVAGGGQAGRAGRAGRAERGREAGGPRGARKARGGRGRGRGHLRRARSSSSAI